MSIDTQEQALAEAGKMKKFLKFIWCCIAHQHISVRLPDKTVYFPGGRLIHYTTEEYCLTCGGDDRKQDV